MHYTSAVKIVSHPVLALKSSHPSTCAKQCFLLFHFPAEWNVLGSHIPEPHKTASSSISCRIYIFLRLRFFGAIPEEAAWMMASFPFKIVESMVYSHMTAEFIL